MPLARLIQAFTGCSYTTPTVFADRPGWLWASKSDVWMDDDPSQIATVSLVYRSPLVKDTKPLYRPVADLLLKADRVDLLAEGELEDEHMIHGRGLWFVSRLTPFDFVESPTCPSLSTIRQITQAAAAEGIAFV